MIICSGENLIDFVPNSEDSESFKACVGGSPLNPALCTVDVNYCCVVPVHCAGFTGSKWV